MDLDDLNDDIEQKKQYIPVLRRYCHELLLQQVVLAIQQKCE